jgi:eukaryotic-like serine/threonine-protein kinase
MTDSPDKAPQREPLSAPPTYDPVSSDQIFPHWERNLRFAALAALVVVAVVGYRYWKAQQPAPVVAEIHFPQARQWTSGAGLTLSPAISHSGKWVAYSSDRDGPGSLAIWTQPFDSGKATRLTVGEFNESDPDFSPDDSQIVFRSERDGGGIYLVPAAGGGPPRLVTKEAWKPRFSPDGKWIAFSKLSGSEDSSVAFGAGQIFIVPSEGGDPRRIQPDFPLARFPIWAPDSRHLLFVGTRADGSNDWWVTGLDGSPPVRTGAVDRLKGQIRAVGMPEHWQGERIVFSAAEEAHPHLWELPISPSSWQAYGSPRRLTDGQGIEQQSAIGPDGRLLFGSVKVATEIYSLSIEPNEARVLGKLEPVTNHGGKAQLPSMTFDGAKIVYISDQSGMRDVWINDLTGKTEERVTTFHQIGYRPVISADGKHVVYAASEDGKCAVLIQPTIAGSRPAALQGCFALWDWSPDRASLLIFRSNAELNKVELMRLPSQERKVVLSHPTRSIYDARFSRDGRWIAFASGPGSGQARIFIAPLQGPAIRESEWIPIGADLGGEPAWSPDGNVLYYRSKRDGYHCIWAHRLGPGKKPLGEPIPVQHLHTAASGLFLMKATEFNLAVAQDRLVLNLAKATGALWTIK